MGHLEIWGCECSSYKETSLETGCCLLGWLAAYGVWETQFEDGAVKRITLLSAPEVPHVVKLGSRDWEFLLFFLAEKVGENH